MPNCNCSGKFSIVSGNSLDIDVKGCESEIRADIVVSSYDSIRLWGRIIDCNGEPIANALIKLVKVVCCGNSKDYKGIAHTISDCEGFYQFEICTDPCDLDKDCYKLLVSKAAYGPERIIPTTGGNCDPCDDSDGYPFDPCREYPPIITPPGGVGNGGTCCNKPKNSTCNYSKSRY